MRPPILCIIALLTACRSMPDVKEGSDGLTDDGSLSDDSDGDGFSADEDCDDQDAAVGPGAEELCAGIDNNCDGLIDEGVMSTWFLDRDGDGFGDSSETVEACELPDGAVPNSTDCDDRDATIWPGAEELCDELDNDCDGAVDEDTGGTWFADADGDGFGDPTTAVDACETPEGFVADNTDCDDDQVADYPGAVEVCDERDNNCDGFIDEGLTSEFYRDADGDGHGDPASPEEACSLSDGLARTADDCDDLDSRVHPSASEICDGLDNDCDGATDDADDDVDLATAERWFSDSDGDGFGDATRYVVACEPLPGTVYDDNDCDDEDPRQNPDAPELCNGEDDDCDYRTDEDDAEDAQTWFADADGDGFGDAATTRRSCETPEGYDADATDCDDGDPLQYPGAGEYCNSEDDDCDGDIDENDAIDARTWHADADGDGFGDPTTGTIACTAPSGTITDDSDCDDDDAAVNPAASEICDGVDNDCDVTTSEDGMVTYATSSGTYDVTSTFTGSSGAPVWLGVTDAGTVTFCDGTYEVYFEVEADVTFTSIHGDPTAVVLDAEGESSVLNIETDGLSVAVEGLTLTGGDGDGTVGGYANTGGAVNCMAASLPSTISISDSVITGNTGGGGGGIAAELCDVELSGATVQDNTSEAGGGLLVIDGDIDAEDSIISDNDGEDAGAVFHIGGSATLTDTRIDDNSAEDVGAWLAFESSLSCEATTTGAAGFTGNLDDVYGAIVLLPDSSLDATNCDFGTAAGGDDNAPFDVMTSTWFEYRWGDGRTVSCDDETCGTPTTDTAGDTSEDFTGADRMRGNVEVVAGTPTIHGFDSYLTVDGTGGSCDLYWYLLTSPTGTGPWTVEWSDVTTALDGTGFFSSGDIGKVLADGEHVLFATAWESDCDVTYHRGSTGSFGMAASHHGWAYDNDFSESEYTGRTTTAVTSLPSTVVYYQRVTYTD